jgi:hypothetical protein
LALRLASFLFPFVFLPPPPAGQLTEVDARTPIVARGSFIDANPRDPIHLGGKGSVAVHQDSARKISSFA